MAESVKGAVLLHGFGASPWQMEELSDCLSYNGLETHNVQIAGHGTNLEDFASTSWQDWCRSAGNAYFNMLNDIDNVYLVGQSMGGVLALFLGQYTEPAGIISINTPIWLKDKRAKLAGLVKYLISSIPVEREDEEKEHYYNRRPLAAVEQLVKLISLNKKGLHKVKSRLLVIQSTDDPTVEPKSANRIFHETGSEDKTIYLYKSDEHVITRGKHKEKIFPEILEFMEQ